jgi:ATP-dependent 26S proteasome regulatory subunit
LVKRSKRSKEYFVIKVTMKIEDIIHLQMVQGMGANFDNNNLFGMAMQMTLQMGMVFIMSFVEELKKLYPVILEKYKHKFFTKPLEETFSQNKDDETLEERSVSLNRQHNFNKVYLTRIYQTDGKIDEKTERMNETVDAVLSFISRLNNVPTLEFINNSSYIVKYTEAPIQIRDDIYVQVVSIVSGKDECSLTSIKLVLMSEKLSSKSITNAIKKIHESYILDIANSMGDTLYYFEQREFTKSSIDPRGIPNIFNDKFTSKERQELLQLEEKNKRAMKLTNAPKNLRFTMQEFFTNKTFESLYGYEAEQVYNHVNFFENNKDWYKRMGVPYHLGMMFFGTPGCGKTATIKAIANYTKRHVINVNFKNILTGAQFRDLFFNKDIIVGEEQKRLVIPISKRLYVLEEIDAINNIVKKRSSDSVNESENDELTLGEILTILDGTLEMPGRMFVITTNHPEKIDDALTRPGRIDLLLRFSKAKAVDISKMFMAFFDKKIDSELIPDNKLTYAEVQQTLLKYAKNTGDFAQDFISDLVSKASSDESFNGCENESDTSVENSPLRDNLWIKEEEKLDASLRDILNSTTDSNCCHLLTYN